MITKAVAKVVKETIISKNNFNFLEYEKENEADY